LNFCKCITKMQSWKYNLVDRDYVLFAVYFDKNSQSISFETVQFLYYILLLPIHLLA